MHARFPGILQKTKLKNSSRAKRNIFFVMMDENISRKSCNVITVIINIFDFLCSGFFEKCLLSTKIKLCITFLNLKINDFGKKQNARKSSAVRFF